jgi:hypothetical protein
MSSRSPLADLAAVLPPRLDGARVLGAVMTAEYLDIKTSDPKHGPLDD